MRLNLALVGFVLLSLGYSAFSTPSDPLNNTGEANLLRSKPAVLLRQPLPDSSFVLSIVGQSPPRLVKIDTQLPQHLAEVETLYIFENGSEPSSLGTWCSRYLYFTVFQPSTRRSFIYTFNTETDQTESLGQTISNYNSIYVTSSRIYYYEINKIGNWDLIGIKCSESKAATQEVIFRFDSEFQPAYMPAAVADDTLFFLSKGKIFSVYSLDQLTVSQWSPKYDGDDNNNAAELLLLESLFDQKALLWADVSGFIHIHSFKDEQHDINRKRIPGQFIAKVSENEIIVALHPGDTTLVSYNVESGESSKLSSVGQRRSSQQGTSCVSDADCPTNMTCSNATQECQLMIQAPESQTAKPNISCIVAPPSHTGFTCIEGMWNSEGSIRISPNVNHVNNLTVASVARINGNFTVDVGVPSDQIVLSIRAQSRLIVTGCVELRGTVWADLSGALSLRKEGSIDILSFGSFCSPPSNKRFSLEFQFSNLSITYSSAAVAACETVEASIQTASNSVSIVYKTLETSLCPEKVAAENSRFASIVAGAIISAVLIAAILSVVFYVTIKFSCTKSPVRRTSSQRSRGSAPPLSTTASVSNDPASAPESHRNMLTELDDEALIPMSEIRVLHEIGTGSFGKVFLAQYRGALVALKQLKSATSTQIQTFIHEIALHSQLKPHHNVCKLYGACADRTSNVVSIVVEYCPNRSVSDILESTLPLSDDLMAGEYETFKVIYGVALAMVHLSRSKVVHRDISAKNVVLDENLFPKLSDFGVPRSSADALNAGPIRWMAPECFEGHYSDKSDVWSFGCFIIELITADFPFSYFRGTIADLAIRIREEGLSPLDDLARWLEEADVKLAKWIRDVLEPCFAKNPEDRPKPSKIVAQLQQLRPGFYMRYGEEADTFVASPLTLSVVSAQSPASFITASPRKLVKKTSLLESSESVGFGGDTSSEEELSESPSLQMKRISFIRSITRDVSFIPRLPDVSKARIITKLGSGKFSVVHLGKFEGRFVAIKQISETGTKATAIFKEAAMMATMPKHRNVINYLGVRHAAPSTVELVMDIATQGTLLNFIKCESDPKHGKPLQENLVFRFALGVARGMAAFAKEKIIHRNLCARSILLNSTLEPLVSDISCIRQLEPSPDAAPWMAPETFGPRRSFSEKSDVWSFGVFLCELVLGDIFYCDMETKMDLLIEKIKGGELNPLSLYAKDFETLSPPSYIISVMKMIFKQEPNNRPTFSAIVSWLEKNAPSHAVAAEERRVKRKNRRERFLQT